jgi:hypothetical protein
LFKLRNVTQDAAISQIPPGNYTEIRMHIVSAMAQVNGNAAFPAIFPPDKIDIIVHFEVKAGQTTGLILDIQVDTVKIAQNPQNNVAPVIKATVTPPA